MPAGNAQCLYVLGILQLMPFKLRPHGILCMHGWCQPSVRMSLLTHSKFKETGEMPLKIWLKREV